VRRALAALDRKRLRLWLLLFFAALAIPAGVLVRHAYSQLKWEAFHHHQLLAEEVTMRVDEGLMLLISREEQRSFSDYAFLVVAGDPSAGFLQRSPLSAFPPEAAIPGLVGFFQVDSDGEFSTPILPAPGVVAGDYGIAPSELQQRISYAQHIRQILSDNRLVGGGQVVAERPILRRDKKAMAPLRSYAADQDAESGRSSMEGAVAMPEAMRAPAEAEEQVMGQAAFDELNAPAPTRAAPAKQKAGSALGRVEDLNLDQRYQGEAADSASTPSASQRLVFGEKRGRKERSALPEPQVAMPGVAREAETPSPELKISMFESEIDPLEFSLLDSGHFVLFRKVWRDGQRYIQGMLIDQGSFLRGMVELAFRGSALGQSSDLAVVYQGEVLTAFTEQVPWGYIHSAEELEGALLYQARLSAPLSDMQLIFSIVRLPAGPGGTLVTWLAVILALVLSAGFYLMYRLGTRQIELAHQQQDFVSAVSHELKTPLTSIRMYSEMLREGWASEEKKKTYYAFIHDESERLSRLIGNVLHLARMTRNEVQVDPKTITVSELMDGIRSKVSSAVERAGFTLNIDCDAQAASATINVDADAFAQIIINLVDNALKFSARSDKKEIDISCQRQHNGGVLFSVRDYGSGVPRDQMKKIFKLFYRSENELTRETVGTGIGLALVHQLVHSMHGQVDVVNRDPGAEFRVLFPG